MSTGRRAQPFSSQCSPVARRPYLLFHLHLLALLGEFLHDLGELGHVGGLVEGDHRLTWTQHTTDGCSASRISIRSIDQSDHNAALLMHRVRAHASYFCDLLHRVCEGVSGGHGLGAESEQQTQRRCVSAPLARRWTALLACHSVRLLTVICREMARSCAVRLTNFS